MSVKATGRSTSGATLLLLMAVGLQTSEVPDLLSMAAALQKSKMILRILKDLRAVVASYKPQCTWETHI